MFSKFKTQILYVKIRKNSLTIKSVKENKDITLDATIPFTTKRLLIAEFAVFQELLEYGIEQLGRNLIVPIAIMHPLENIDETLSEVEEKVLKEVALSAGAREVKLWVGKELTDDEVLDV